MLHIRSLTAAYGPKTVLHDVSLDVAAGGILALIGPNGAGKTTLIRAVSGTVPLAGGQVTVDGQDVTALTPAQRARKISVVPQARPQGGAFTVEQAVMMGRTAYLGWLGRPSEADHQAVQQALQQTRLADFARRPIARLSGGEQQRVLLARALAQSAPVMLLDEPTSSLDLQHQSGLLSLLRKLTVEKQLAVLMAVHDLNLVSLFADRVALLVEGRLRATGTPREVLTPDTLRDAYQTPVTVISHPESGTPLVLPALPL